MTIVQYEKSTRINGIINAFADAINQSGNTQSFYDTVWNVKTAKGFGLDIWGRIVGVSRLLKIPLNINYAGFNPYYMTFGYGQLYSGIKVTQNYYISDDNYRILILTKALSNISGTSVFSLNKILRALFGSNTAAFVVDFQNMTMGYIFNFTVSPVQRAMITQSGVLPHASGVATFAIFGNIFQTLGFNPYGLTFGYGQLFDANTIERIA